MPQQIEVKLFGCQQILIHADKDVLAILEYLCRESNKIYNCATYYARQIWFITKQIANRAEICASMVSNPHFGAMYVSSSQQTCNAVAEAFSSFKELMKAFSKGELEHKPSPPKYRKSGGLYTISFPVKWLKFTSDGLRIPLGKKVKAWFGVDCFYLPMPTNLEFKDIKEVRILPRNRCFYAEFVYKLDYAAPLLDKLQALSIDHGVNNWLTCVDTLGNSFIVDGKHLKSVNQWYNKQISTIKEGKTQGFWSNKLAAITEKRNRQMRDAINKAARIVVNHCVKNGIGTIVMGWNPRQKDSANMGRKKNQQFVQIPTARLKDRVIQLCEQSGIDFVETEEANTSVASFLDGDTLPKHGEKPTGWKASGKRIKRGLYRTAKNWYVNADAQAAANCLVKVAVRLGLDLSRIGRGALTTPLRVRFWAT